MRIYLAGPYSDNLTNSQEARLANTIKVIDAGIALVKKGHAPFIPHLTHWVDERARQLGVELSWQEYMEWDDAWLTQCQALLYLGSSKGADQELRRAQGLGMRIYYSLSEVPDESR